MGMRRQMEEFTFTTLIMMTVLNKLTEIGTTGMDKNGFMTPQSTLLLVDLI